MAEASEYVSPPLLYFVRIFFNTVIITGDDVDDTTDFLIFIVTAHMLYDIYRAYFLFSTSINKIVCFICSWKFRIKHKI